MTRPRIGIFLKSDDPNAGPGRYVRSLMKAMDREEFEVVRFANSPRTGDEQYGQTRVVALDARPVAQGAGPRLAETGAAPPKSKRSTLARELAPFALRYSMGFERETHRLARVLGSCPVDLLHTSETGCEESAVAARIAGVPAVLGTFHVLPSVDVDQQRQHWIHRRLERKGARALDLSIAVSEAGRSAWMQRAHLSPSRVLKIHNGIDTEQFQRRRGSAEARRELGVPADGSVVIGTISRLVPVKGLDDLLRAAAQLRDQGLNVRLVIAGDGPSLTDLRRRSEELGIGAYVHFVGQRADAAGALEAFDMFAHPSLSEALPYAVMEAMSMELPVVATDVGGVPEIVVPEQTGFLVPCREPGVLAAGLKALVESSALRTRMGRAGRQRILKCFDERQMAERTIGLYRTMLRESRAA
jgi:glycosyltransferase involved in cell wall biosynthesis